MTCDVTPDAAIRSHMNSCKDTIMATIACRRRLIGVEICRYQLAGIEEESVAILTRIADKYILSGMKMRELPKAMAIMWHETVKWSEEHMRNCENLR